jgi:alkylated DNA repair dioxygenase AlkB
VRDSGNVALFPSLFNTVDSGRLFERLVAEIPWQQRPIRIFGRMVLQPRLTAWMGDPDSAYSYSGIDLQPLVWSPTVSEIRNRVQSLMQTPFNGVLLNYYRNGRDSMGWHRDNEPELGRQPIIASVSLGAVRRFQMRTYREKSGRIDIELPNGSLLVMAGDTQQNWEHGIPKQLKIDEGRINLTFRTIVGRIH